LRPSLFCIDDRGALFQKRKQSASDSDDDVSSSDGDDSKSGDDIGIDKSNIVHGRRARKPIKYNFDDSDEDDDE
jgi:hypothetical protein